MFDAVLKNVRLMAVIGATGFGIVGTAGSAKADNAIDFFRGVLGSGGGGSSGGTTHQGYQGNGPSRRISYFPSERPFPGLPGPTRPGPICPPILMSNLIDSPFGPDGCTPDFRRQLKREKHWLGI